MTFRKHRIVSVESGSAAQRAGITAGDRLSAVNGRAVCDVFDYRTLIAEEELTLSVEKADGTLQEIGIVKEEYEDLGLEFENALMDREKSCRNRCVFCFVDQLPRNLRKSLYYKDDDLRLSFLTGNYVTLTNISGEELRRLASYKLSPLNISVHATSPEIRVRILGNPKAGQIMEQLTTLAQEGIRLNTQIVLCPEMNDGAELERTLDDLESLGEAVQSIAIVPVGLTGFRGDRDLAYIRPLGRSDAKAALNTVLNRQQKNLRTAGRRLVFAADELYIKAGFDLPDVSEYEDLYQLENGVGTIALFRDEMDRGMAARIRKGRRAAAAGAGGRPKVMMLTGTDAKPYLEGYTEVLSGIYGADFEARAITNRFFGETVTVAGLVTGTDIVREVAPEGLLTGYSSVLVPDVMLRYGGESFLDDMTVAGLEKKLGTAVRCVPSSGSGFLEALDGIYGGK